jgi:hypothetical protein
LWPVQRIALQHLIRCTSELDADTSAAIGPGGNRDIRWGIACREVDRLNIPAIDGRVLRSGDGRAIGAAFLFAHLIPADQRSIGFSNCGDAYGRSNHNQSGEKPSAYVHGNRPSRIKCLSAKVQQCNLHLVRSPKLI